MSLLQPAKNTMAYLKMGIYGDTGSGKTWTASEVAIGLHKHCKLTKPVGFFDTETGSSFVLPRFKSANVPLFVHSSTALKDLVEVMDEAESKCSILIIDSITNVWDEFTDAYMRKRNQNYIELWDWKPIKKEWRTLYRNRFVNSKLHIIMCGREGAIYTTEEQERNGKTKKITVKDGTKMRAEGDTGYEPSLLCEMIKIYEDGTGTYVRRCNVVKERFGVIDSKSFDNPTFNHFLPHINNLNIGGEHVGLIASTSDDLFDDDGDGSFQRMLKARAIALEELDAILTKAGLTGTSKESKLERINILEELLGTSAKTAIENKKPDEIWKAVKEIEARYLSEPQSTESTNDMEVPQS